MTDHLTNEQLAQIEERLALVAGWMSWTCADGEYNWCIELHNEDECGFFCHAPENMATLLAGYRAASAENAAMRDLLHRLIDDNDLSYPQSIVAHGEAVNETKALLKKLEGQEDG